MIVIIIIIQSKKRISDFYLPNELRTELTVKSRSIKRDTCSDSLMSNLSKHVNPAQHQHE